ncbi:hypothetical protein O6H91_07G024700 [Diphasiastrum complanatum]|uniref:Uncharacterized protein n=1 Tax=Diphasiastrum complanatum TaxID=34168 RepID=A0ACC2D372_DIPCM|nr:hypothetical protein O6H91_07G024700 [Diphasiastrum complanatum]
MEGMVVAGGFRDGRTAAAGGFANLVQNSDGVARARQDAVLESTLLDLQFQREWFQVHSAQVSNRVDHNSGLLQHQFDSHPYVGLQHEVPKCFVEVAQVEAVEDPALRFVDEILRTDQELEELNGAQLDRKSFQAIAKELSDLISHSSLNGDSQESVSDRTRFGMKKDHDPAGATSSINAANYNRVPIAAALYNAAGTIPDLQQHQSNSVAASGETFGAVLKSENDLFQNEVPHPQGMSFQINGYRKPAAGSPCNYSSEQEKTVSCTRKAGRYRKHHGKERKIHETNPADNRNEEPCQKSVEHVLLHVMLVECAKAVAASETEKAYTIIEELRKIASPYGNIYQRLTYYFTEGLVARITGTGYLLYTAMARDRPSEADMLKAYHLYGSRCPNVRLSHLFSNQSILNAIQKAKQLHIVDFAIQYGFQWQCLIKALASRSTGAPRLRITRIVDPIQGEEPETRHRLQEYARACNISLEYTTIAIRWENFFPSAIAREQGELLVVNLLFGLRHLVDESVPTDPTSSARRVLLTKIGSMQPALVVQGVWNAPSCNSPFFGTRFLEALSHYGVVFDAVDVSVPREHLQRLVVEQQMWGREILNIVACEGEERVERPESYRRWQEIMCSAGFEQLPLPPQIYNKALSVRGSFHKDHAISHDRHWLLHSWKNRVLHAFATWRPLL